jgi:hypothetical protein
MVRIRSVQPLDAFRVRLEFIDGTQREADLEPYLHGPIFEPIRNDPHMFRSVHLVMPTMHLHPSPCRPTRCRSQLPLHQAISWCAALPTFPLV